MKDNLIKGYIPLDKSWMIRMAILDFFNGYNDCINFLEQNYADLSDDLKSLYFASLQWNGGGEVDVGESGTLYRFLKFASWKLGEEKTFTTKGTLTERVICSDPEIVNLSTDELLRLDNETSQWASASVLMGNRERISNAPYKLQLTYEAVEHWERARSKREMWNPRYDETILKQAAAYLNWVSTGKMDFFPEQAEDYCFARAFGIITNYEGEKRWPSLRGHESDRISEMEEALKQEEVKSRDHRVVQAIAMLKGDGISFAHPDSVNKSWPQFWKFLSDVQSNSIPTGQ